MQVTPIDVIITSCGRFDLLRRTLDSFYKYNTFPIRTFTVYDDYGANKGGQQYEIEIEQLRLEYLKITFAYGRERIGQIQALNKLMRGVITEYYFTLEDDWEFYKSGFIERSIEILDNEKDIINVWLRSGEDTNGHPSEPIKNCIYRILSDNHVNKAGIWTGFTFNPSVRRLSDYNLIGSYSKHATFNPQRPWDSECKIGLLYRELGYKAAILPQGYVKHIGGDGRGIRG